MSSVDSMKQDNGKREMWDSRGGPGNLDPRGT